MQVSAASKSPPKSKKRVQRQMCVQVMAFAVGPNGRVEGLEGVDDAIARENNVVESRAARIDCSIALLRTSGGHDVVRLWRCRTNRAFIR